MVGVYYANGIGLTQSYTKAKEWWTKAAEPGNEDAIYNLKELDKMGEELHRLISLTTPPFYVPKVTNQHKQIVR